MLDLLSTHSGSLILADLPDALHHTYEVFVTGQAHGEIRVVVTPFLSADRAVIVSTHAVKTVKELFKNFLTRLGAINEVLVLGDVVKNIDISNGDLVGVVTVDQCESLVDHILPALAKGITKATNELLVRDVAITIDIVELHQCLDLDDLRE